MSERGSFVTEYVNCPKCFTALKRVLLDTDKFLNSVTIPCWTGEGDHPIIAGKVGHSWGGGEIDAINDLLDGVELCHPVRVAVLCDNGQSEIIERTI